MIFYISHDHKFTSSPGEMASLNFPRAFMNNHQRNTKTNSTSDVQVKITGT